MGRRKKRKKGFIKTKEERLDEREDLLKDLRREHGFMELWQFIHWERYYRNKESYLEAFENWLEAKMRNPSAPVRPVTDVDLKLMPQYAHQVPAHVPAKEYGKNYWQGSWNDDVDDGMGGYLFREKLPLTPRIAAPSGLSGAELFVL